MLQALAGEPLPDAQWNAVLAAGKTDDLQRIGCMAYALVQRTDDAPGILAPHGLILSGGDHHAPLGMRQRGVIEYVGGLTCTSEGGYRHLYRIKTPPPLDTATAT